MSEYVLVINVYNEENRVKAVFEMIKKQTKLPGLFLWIDDGCTDNTVDRIAEHSKSFPGPVKILHSPPKTRPNYDTIGVAWNNVYSEIKSLTGFDYLMITDADSIFPANYAEEMLRFMDAHPDVGVAAGDIQGESRRRMPQNAGKVVRWSIVRNITRFWDLVPDTFWNIKALSMGYKIVILSNPTVKVPPSAGYSLKGRFRFGRLMYYIQSHPLLVVLRAILFQIRERSGTMFLRGYFTEWMRGTWVCDLPMIRSFYSLRGTIIYTIMPNKLRWFFSS
ncbi:MAG: glycosyltransferase [Candidatus Thorarchaeota archaeon]